MNKITLPPLPFGDAVAKATDNIDLYRDALSKVITSLKSYEALGNPLAFQSKTQFICIGGMKLVAGANTPVSVDVGECDDTTLMIPFFGENLTLLQGVGYRWAAGENALLIPAQGRGGFSSLRSTLNIDINPAQLKSVIQSMLGNPDKEVKLDLQETRGLALSMGDFSFDGLFRQLCGMIDSYLDSVEVLEMLAIDDQFYRGIAMMMRPDLFLTDTCRHAGTQRKTIETLCEYLRAHIDRRISLSDMERISNMSARSLQYAFRQKYGLSPLQWVRNERLHLARRRLIAAQPGDSVTFIAMSCGMMHLSQFSTDYRKVFGESPSETLSRVLQQELKPRPS